MRRIVPQHRILPFEMEFIYLDLYQFFSLEVSWGFQAANSSWIFQLRVVVGRWAGEHMGGEWCARQDSKQALCSSQPPPSQSFQEGFPPLFTEKQFGHRRCLTLKSVRGNAAEYVEVALILLITSSVTLGKFLSSLHFMYSDECWTEGFLRSLLLTWTL